MRENYKATAADIANECAVSTEYLSRVCRDVMGVSVKELITVYRMKIATNWLRYTSVPIKQLAEEVGYNDKNTSCVRSADFRNDADAIQKKELESILKWSTSE
ncbi:MAG: helix-turn-helix domain-containing protein [Christensenellales bacterium]